MSTAGTERHGGVKGQSRQRQKLMKKQTLQTTGSCLESFQQMSGCKCGVGVTQSALTFWKFTLAMAREWMRREKECEFPAMIQMRGMEAWIKGKAVGLESYLEG